MAVGWEHIPTFQNSSSGTDAPGMPGPLGSWAGRFLSCPPSLFLFQPTCPQKPASSSPNISRSRASARGRHIMGHRRTGFKSPISARISFHSSGPALTTSCYSPRTISSPASSPFPTIHWISSPSPCSSPLHSLAYSLHYLLPLRLLSWCEKG